MDRRHLATGLIIAVVAAAALAWWLSGHTTYQPTQAASVTIAGDSYHVTRWSGVTVPGARQKDRACFRIKRTIAAPPELQPRPTNGPQWLRCFDSGFIKQALASGDARAYVAQRDDPKGWDRIVVVLSGHRAYMWHQRHVE